MNASIKSIIFVLFVFASIPGVLAAASFQITLLTCTPAEVKVNGVFSCTANIRNAGDAAGTVGTVTLYPDSNNWLESSNYPKSVSQSVNPGESIEVTFPGLKGVKSGNNGFSEIRIDNVADTSSAVTGVKVNTIDVVVSVSNSKSSAVMSSTFISTAEVTAGGNIDVLLTFTVDSGGCSIGNQDSQKTISGMQNGNKQSRTWTVTQGTSGDCKFTVSATATGNAGVSTKTDSTKSTITCTDCPTSSGSEGSAGGGGGGGVVKAAVGELTQSLTYDLASNEKVSFFIGGENHSVRVLNFTETTAEIEVRSDLQRFTFIVGEEKKIDLNHDGKNDISVKLNSINILTKKAKITLTPLQVVQAPSTGTSEPVSPAPSEGNAPSTSSPSSRGETGAQQESGEEGSSNWLMVGLIIAVILIIIIIIIVMVKRRKRR